MFVRVKTSPNTPKKAVQIVESYRDGDKVRQKIIRHVGMAFNDFELDRLKDLASHIIITMETEVQPSLFNTEELAQLAIESRKAKERQKEEEQALYVDLKKLREEQRIIVGIHEVYGEIYRELGFEKVLGNPRQKVAISKLLQHMVMARIAKPISKRASVKMLDKDFGIKLNLEKVYRMMDMIDDQKEQYIKTLSYKSALGMLKEKINVIFYDTTTLYFESFTEDELKQNGYSKDMKFNQPQVLLAILVTQFGLPIGYQVYPGSQYEGHTLEDALNHLESKYNIDKIIFVADSGLLNDDNLLLLESKGKKYIVGARLKNLPVSLQKDILDKEQYDKTSCQDIPIDSLKVFAYKNDRKLIVCYSKTRAEKDRHDREKAIEKLQKKLQKNKNPKALMSNYGYKKYIKIQGETNIVVDEEKIQKAQLWDGLHGVITNIDDMKAVETLSHYHGLWQIEESFRITKHDLRIRPIFHWTPRRIKAHIAISFMALVCLRHLEYRLALQFKKLSPEVIRNELLHVQLSIVKHIKTGKRYAIPSKITQNARKIYQVIGKKLDDVPFEIKTTNSK